PPPVVPRNPDLQHVARTVLKAKRIAVVCGAGISTATGIPDFRSGAGLFESLKKQYPDARLSSGKDLFDVGLFQSEQTASIFYNMIAALHKQADGVAPTAFHSWLKQLDNDGKLFRVYTQNIDALEEKAGLTYGLGDKTLPLPPRRRTAAPRSPSKSSTTATSAHASGSTTPLPAASASSALGPTSSQMSLASSTASTASTSYPTPRSSQSPPPTHSTIPRCIPLHGHLSTLSCSFCKLVTPTAAYLDLLSSGTAPLCPACLAKEALRSAAGERARGVGVLRPDVVLYGEEHKDGERVGEITQRDLMGQRPDLLLVVGTTLKVKGTKRLVRELAKVIKPVSASSTASSSSSTSAPTTTTTTSSSTKQAPVHTIYLNAEFPSPAREWADVFDVWCRGDIQEFVAALAREAGRVESEARERDERRRARVEKAQGRKRAAEEAAAAGGAGASAATSAKVGSAAALTAAPSPIKAARPPPLDRSHLPTVRSPTKAALGSAAAAGALPLLLPRPSALPLLPLENAPEPSRARVRTRAVTPPASPASASASASASAAAHHAGAYSLVAASTGATAGAPPAKRPRTRASPPAPATSASAPRPQPFALELSPPPRPGSASGSSSRSSATRSSSTAAAPVSSSATPAFPYSLPALPPLSSAPSQAKPTRGEALVRSAPLVDGAGKLLLVRSASSSSLSSVASSHGLGGDDDMDDERADSLTAHDIAVVVADSAEEDSAASPAPGSSQRKRGRPTVKRSGTSTSASTSMSTSTSNSTASSRKSKRSSTTSPGASATTSRRTTRSSPHGVGVRARRSSRASTASATQSSLDAAATRRTSPGASTSASAAAAKPVVLKSVAKGKGAKAHEQEHVQAQTRLAFEVTKKRVGDVTGTKRR
ncbi:uncharacterized protein RHOBADRAFT_45153, partial [Rhodotorula graminis WP1]